MQNRDTSLKYSVGARRYAFYACFWQHWAYKYLNLLLSRYYRLLPGAVPMRLDMIDIITSSAPPPMECKRRSR